MRKISEIESEINDIQTQVESIEEKLSVAETSLDTEKRNYSEAIIKSAGPEVLSQHRDSVTACIADHEALAGAKELLSDDLKRAENEKSIVHLHQTEGFRHSSNMNSVDECISTLNKDLPRLRNLVLTISDTIKNAVSGVENACSGLDSVAKGLDETLSLESFLAGNLESSGDETREEVLDDIGNDLRDTVSSLDVPETINMAELQGSLNSLVKWRALVTTFTGVGLIRNPKRLYSPIKKRPSTQKIYVPTRIPSETPEATGRPRVPAPKFNRNRPHGEQRVMP